MRVLVVSHSYAVAENQKNIAALQRHAEVRVAVPHVITDRVIGRIKAHGQADDTYLISRRIALPRHQYLLASPDLGLRTFPADVIHIEYDPWTPIFWQTCMARTRHAPDARIVCTAKKNTLRRLPPPIQGIKEGLARRLLARVAHVIAINEGVRRIYRTVFDVPTEKLTLMQHLGIDPQIFHPCATRRQSLPLVVGYCGRIDHHKGVHDLLSAIGAIEERQPGRVLLKMLGDGSLRNEIAARNLPWLQILPPVAHDKVADFMRDLDLFVMPSLILPDHEEHDGHAVMEAMACGIATIGSTSGIIPELLGDGCGEIYPAGDTAELTRRLDAALSSPRLRSELSRRALERVTKSYSVDAIAARKAKIYSRILEA